MIYGKYKFIEFDDAERNALYNLEEDSAELVNLLQEKAGHTQTVNWTVELDSWFEEYADLEFSEFTLSPEQLQRLRSLGYVQ